MSSPFDIKEEDFGIVNRDDQESAEAWAVSLMPGWLSRVRLELPRSRKSLEMLIISFVLITILFLIQLYRIQIIDGNNYKALAAGNRLRETTIYAERGKILDRNGQVLAQNTASFQVVVQPYLLNKNKAERQKDYQNVAKILGVPVSDIESKIDDKKLNSIGPILIADRVDHQIGLVLETELPKIEGFNIETIPIRSYIRDAALSPVLGYVNRVSDNDLKNNPELSPVDFVGREGVEKSFDTYLRGVNGKKRILVDSAGQPARTLSNINQVSGKDLQLTIDLNLQRTLTDSLSRQIAAANARRGSVVAINPKNGEVLAMVSLPSYDNNLFSGGIRQSDYSNLLNNPDNPLLNRVTSGGYPVGSSIKPLVASAALQEGIIDENTTVVDQGQITLVNPGNPSDTLTFHGYQGIALGPVNVKTAIAKSSNIFFYTLGGGYGPIKGLGGNRLADYYGQFGLGQKTGIELGSELSGIVPDPDWKQKVLGQSWFTGDSYNIAIGQGDLQVSPLQLAMAHAAIVNGGEVLEAHLEKGKPKKVRSVVNVNQENFNIVRQGMRLAVTSGTIGDINFGGLPPVAGKTGTAETVTKSDSSEPHIWEAVHAPADDPEILIVAMIEHGTYSSRFLSPVVGDGLRTYFADRK